MKEFIAALPMYEWPEVRDEIDAEWARLRVTLGDYGIDAPGRIVRRNGDLPAVPGGIRDATGHVIAPDPASLPASELDFHALWLHPQLLFTQTCWGPMELGLARHVQLVGQPSYDAFEGGQGEFYSSALVMRRTASSVPAPREGEALLPLDLMRDRRFAYNSLDSMSGIIALTRDLEEAGENLDIFSERNESGGHRQSIVAVAEGRADIAAIDCRSWALAQRFEPDARDVSVVGWTRRRKGLPYITGRNTPAELVEKLRAAFAAETQPIRSLPSSG
jgi:ABC-type phosphate/phosphonate transport system substrate-binding protein